MVRKRHTLRAEVCVIVCANKDCNSQPRKRAACNCGFPASNFCLQHCTCSQIGNKVRGNVCLRLSNEATLYVACLMDLHECKTSPHVNLLVFGINTRHTYLLQKGGHLTIMHLIYASLKRHLPRRILFSMHSLPKSGFPEVNGERRSQASLSRRERFETD